MKSRAVKVALICLFVGLTAVAFERIPRTRRADQGDLFVPRPEVAKIASFGFDTALADYYWLQAVQVVGREPHPEKHAPLLGQLIDVVTTLDPWVDHPYRFAAVWLIDSEESVRHANRLLERGIEHHPFEWRNRFYLGFNQFYYLGEDDKAADTIEGAVGLLKAPSYLGRLVARLRTGDGGLDAAETFMHELLRNTVDTRTASDYKLAIQEIRTERLARRLDAAREEFKRRFQRDIESVDELVTSGVLPALPPEPHGKGWEINSWSHKIVSGHYMRRYELHMQNDARRRRDMWKSRGESRGAR